MKKREPFDKAPRQDQAAESPLGSAARPGMASTAGQPGITEGGMAPERSDTLSEMREAADKSPGEPTGERGDLGDSPPGED